MPFQYSEKDILLKFRELRKRLREIEQETSEYLPAFKYKTERRKLQELREIINTVILKYKRLEQVITTKPNAINYILQDDIDI